MPNALKSTVYASPDLAAVIGTTQSTRSEVTSLLWQYIKDSGLQDQQNKRMINADDKLRVIFGGKDQVSMFEMTAMVNKHLSNKPFADESAASDTASGDPVEPAV